LQKFRVLLLRLILSIARPLELKQSSPPFGGLSPGKYLSAPCGVGCLQKEKEKEKQNRKCNSPEVLATVWRVAFK